MSVLGQARQTYNRAAGAHLIAGRVQGRQRVVDEQLRGPGEGGLGVMSCGISRETDCSLVERKHVNPLSAKAPLWCWAEARPSTFS